MKSSVGLDMIVIVIVGLMVFFVALYFYAMPVRAYRTLIRPMFYGYEDRAFVEAPAGDAGAWYIIVSGDATTDFGTQVFVTSRLKPDDPQDVPKRLVFDGDGEHDLRLRWIDSENLEIHCLDPEKKIQIRRERLGSVLLHYLNCAQPIQGWIR